MAKVKAKARVKVKVNVKVKVKVKVKVRAKERFIFTIFYKNKIANLELHHIISPVSSSS
jgi:hypothetical protein